MFIGFTVSTTTMNVPVFIDISLEDQAEELRVYFKSLGAEISAERSEKGIEDDLHKGQFTCGVCPVSPEAFKGFTSN